MRRSFLNTITDCIAHTISSNVKRRVIKIVLIFRLSRSSDKCIDVDGVAFKFVEYRVANSTHELVDHPVIGSEGERDREQIEIIEISPQLYSLSVSSRYQQIRGINTISEMGLYLLPACFSSAGNPFRIERFYPSRIYYSYSYYFYYPASPARADM